MSADNPAESVDVFTRSLIPSSWGVASIAEVAALNPSLHRPIDDDSFAVGFVPMAAVGEDFRGIKAAEHRSYGQVKKGYTPFAPGDVIMAKITPCMENGKGGVVRGDPRAVFFGSTEFHVLRPCRGIAADWIGMFLSQESVRRAARLRMKGSAGQLRVPSGFFQQLRIPVAPSEEQRRISDRVAELLSDLEAGAAALERVKRNLVRYRAAVQHAAVTGQLTAAWRERNGPPSETGEQLLQRILVERRRQWEERTLAKYQAEGRQPPKGWRDRYVEPFQSPSPSAANGDIPAGWARARLEQIGFISSGTTPKRGERRFWEGGTVPWVSSSVVNEPYVDSASEFVTETALEETSLKLYAVGTLLVAMYGEGKTRGKVTELRISATCNQALAAISLVQGGASSLQGFVKLCLTAMYEGLRREAVGGVQPNLNGELVARIDIPLPPASEQQEILALAQQRISQIDALESRVAAISARAARLRQAILKAAFEGCLVPQDPSDEPASVLLERIRDASATPCAKKPRREPVRKTAKT